MVNKNKDDNNDNYDNNYNSNKWSCNDNFSRAKIMRPLVTRSSLPWSCYDCITRGSKTKKWIVNIQENGLSIKSIGI